MNRYKTPLRYPGGKQRLAPFVLEVLKQTSLEGGDYVEPFAGGAGVAIELLLNDSVSRIHLNDLSKPVYAFWRAILTKTDEFCRLVASASLTVAEWRRQKEVLSRPGEHDQLTLAFSFFYLNRCNRSGIPSGGCIGGIEQSGEWTIGARFPRNELIRRIELIAARKKAIVIKNCDAETFLENYVSGLPRKTLVYCDPPYFRKSNRLYLNHYDSADHARLAKTIQRTIKSSWLVSYDAVPEIIGYYSPRRWFIYDLQYNAATAYKGAEVLIVSDNLKIPDASSVKCVDTGLRRGWQQFYPSRAKPRRH
ncbi:MAG TPA: DNA adenine methylase [Pirellulales bacterium]|nr:DNA adenine methylase [Pirellulales bacterium]